MESKINETVDKLKNINIFGFNIYKYYKGNIGSHILILSLLCPYIIGNLVVTSFLFFKSLNETVTLPFYQVAFTVILDILILAYTFNSLTSLSKELKKSKYNKSTVVVVNNDKIQLDKNSDIISFTIALLTLVIPSVVNFNGFNYILSLILMSWFCVMFNMYRFSLLNAFFKLKVFTAKSKKDNAKTQSDGNMSKMKTLDDTERMLFITDMDISKSDGFAVNEKGGSVYITVKE